jgi:hypothetical protein
MVRACRQRMHVGVHRVKTAGQLQGWHFVFGLHSTIYESTQLPLWLWLWCNYCTPHSVGLCQRVQQLHVIHFCNGRCI